MTKSGNVHLSYPTFSESFRKQKNTKYMNSGISLKEKSLKVGSEISWRHCLDHTIKTGTPKRQMLHPSMQTTPKTIHHQFQYASKNKGIFMKAPPGGKQIVRNLKQIFSNVRRIPLKGISHGIHTQSLDKNEGKAHHSGEYSNKSGKFKISSKRFLTSRNQIKARVH
jgi:hypothetical protein